jgi:hypothetical protein
VLYGYGDAESHPEITGNTVFINTPEDVLDLLVAVGAT